MNIEKVKVSTNENTPKINKPKKKRIICISFES